MSPTDCLALLRRFYDLVRQGSQLIIDTHSPIIMSFPDALTYVLTENGPVCAKWDEITPGAGIDQRLPGSYSSAWTSLTGGGIVRHDRLGGLLHEYSRAA